MSESRLKNSIINISSGLVFRMVSLLMSFVSRTVFIRILGDECLGLNGLFTTILSIFSLAELGIGQAITFYMYRPVAEKDTKRLAALIGFYRSCYRIIGCVIAIVGIILIPFLPRIVNFETNTGYDITAIYLLYLLNTVVTYLFFSYPQTVLIANQRQYIVNHIESIFVIVSALVEILSLFISRNYMVYLSVRIIIAIIKNVILAIIAIRIYPYIMIKTKEKVNRSEVKDMFKDVYAIFVVKLSSQLFNSTDNLFISAMLGTVVVGYNSNYLMIINAVYGVISTIIYSVGASIGNLYATETKEKTERVFSVLDFINSWISCFCTVSLFQMLNPFITLVWGEQYVFSKTAVVLMCMNFYIVSSLYALFSFRQSLGLFQYCIYNQLFAAIINIILDFILVRIWGISGLLLATVVANLMFSIYPYMKNLYVVGFNMSHKAYVLRSIKGYAICCLCGITTHLMCMRIPVTLWGLTQMAIVCVLVPNVLQMILLGRTLEFKCSVDYVIKAFKNRGIL